MGNKLILTPSGFKHWEVVKDFQIFAFDGVDDVSVEVPKGFRTDLASVPRLLWWLLPPFGRYTQAAVVHDYLYRMEYDRKEADKIFYELMIEYDVWVWKARIMYLGVRAFGWMKR